MRQRIYEMWIAGYKVANIAADFGVNDHTVKSELERGYKRTYPERGIHPPHAVVSRCKPGEGVTFPKDTAPTRGNDGLRWGLWFISWCGGRGRFLFWSSRLYGRRFYCKYGGHHPDSRGSIFVFTLQLYTAYRIQYKCPSSRCGGSTLVHPF